MSSQIILNEAFAEVTPAIDPATLAALNQVWMNNTMQLGTFTLVVGFLIGFASAYIYFKRNYGTT